MMHLVIYLILGWNFTASAASFMKMGFGKAPADPTVSFDRELERAKPGEWNLEDSEAYQNLRSLESGSGLDLGGPEVITGSSLPANVFIVTFDDGPCPGSLRIFEMLKSMDLKATFFWQAQNVLRFPDIVRDAEARGFSLQHHSYSHKNLGMASDRLLRHEIVEANLVLKQRYAKPPRFFRPPFGRTNSRVRMYVNAEHLTTVLWNIDSLDWLDHDPMRVAARVVKQMELAGRGIILFHDIQPHTVEAARMVLEWAKRSSQPIRFLTVDQAFSD